MKNILVVGAGHIGSLISILLLQSKDYKVTVIDNNVNGAELKKLLNIIPKIDILALDVSNTTALCELINNRQIDAVISCLPFYLNEYIATAAKNTNIHYFDLTEDVQTTQKIKKLSENSKKVFVPQCGVAPGFINIVAEYLMHSFELCYETKLRVGGIPKYIDNTLKYGLTWSLDGLINQYCNPCPAIESGNLVMKEPLEDLECLTFDGCEYEAFNTSGGVGNLVSSSLGRVQHLNYKTIRYPGHCEKMRFLIKELKLGEDKKTLFRILEHSLPRVDDDILILYASASGKIKGNYEERHYFKKIMPKVIESHRWTAMQTATASSACTAIDLILSKPKLEGGFIPQTWFDFDEFVNNKFACCFI